LWLSLFSLGPMRLCGKRIYLSQIFLRLFSALSVLNLLTFCSSTVPDPISHTENC
jgi:hypothetical protein